MAEDMNVLEVIYNCRAMRRLDSREVPEELLVKLIDTANQAPSGSNMQNGRWLVVRDPKIKKKLADLNRSGVEAYMGFNADLPDGLPHQTANKRSKMMNAVLWQMEHMHEIPALVIACLEFGTKVNQDLISTSSGSRWPGIQNLLLTARALGLGATPTTLALSNHQAVSEVLNLPDTMAACCLIPVGYPTGKFGPVSRKPTSEIMRFEQWQ